ncbi:phage tail sheath family protein [Alkalihalobacillus trypoxylicola]|uniref:Phage tail sheath protein n=1 Tax=Alkalihalobacillus trypoxylicola TaxID=519424 RepID=A0A162EWD4_9BACI|nr:phage tail sheath family protein [Alkalihalobacillus trypoxylicola]KYG33895.1 phage tail sheath protein [Alkalihalobacillus trypoxylicola]
MNGGTFTPGVEKERAGIYFNFKSIAQQRVVLGERGIVALPLVMNWGEAKTFFSISNLEDLQQKVGLGIDEPKLLLLREAMKRAKTVMLYRLNEGEAARAVIGEEFTAIAQHGGSKGNEIIVQVTENVLDTDKKDIVTYVGVNEVDRQIITTIEELKPNQFLRFEGEGIPDFTAGTRLLGGSDGIATNSDYMSFLEAAETEYFDVIALPVKENQQLKATFVSYLKRLREQQGQKIIGVLSNYAGDYEGIVNVTNGVMLEDGTEITADKATAWVAGASAGATFNQSLTFLEYEGATNVIERYDNEEIIERLKNGEFLFTYDARTKTVSVEKDINSFVSFSSNKSNKMAKNKIIRVLDAVNNDLTHEIKKLIKLRKESGADIPASQDGMAYIKSLINQYMITLQTSGGIENFNSETDVVIRFNGDRDGFLIDIAIQPIDAAEKFYFTVEAR